MVEQATETETYTEWRVTGDPGPGYPPYDFTWSRWRNPHLGDPEQGARSFVALIEQHPASMRDVRLMCRTVTVEPWQEVPRDGS